MRTTRSSAPMETRRNMFRLGFGLAATATAYAASTSKSNATGRHSDPLYCEPLCLLEGTHVLTSRGEIVIEDLKAGDEVVTVCGALRKVEWVGCQVYARDGDAPWSEDVDPVYVEASAIAENVPSRGLFLSPKHALLIDGYLIPARYLVNRESIRQGAYDGDVVRYFHFRCEAHEAVFAEGLPVETLQWKLDNLDRGAEEPLTEADMLESYAPVLGYWNKRDETLALLRRITSTCVDIRDPLQVIYDRLLERAKTHVAA